MKRIFLAIGLIATISGCQQMQQQQEQLQNHESRLNRQLGLTRRNEINVSEHRELINAQQYETARVRNDVNTNTRSVETLNRRQSVADAQLKRVDSKVGELQEGQRRTDLTVERMSSEVDGLQDRQERSDRVFEAMRTVLQENL